MFATKLPRLSVKCGQRLSGVHYRLFSAGLIRAKLPTIDDAYKRRSVHELLDLTGKVSVVTGGGRGIGQANIVAPYYQSTYCEARSGARSRYC